MKDQFAMGKKPETNFQEFCELHFADNDIKDMCFKMDFGFFFERTIMFHNQRRTLYSVIEAWLWEKYRESITIDYLGTGKFHCSINTKFTGIDYPIWNSEKNKEFDSPVVAKIEGLKQAVKYLFNQLKK